jgi:TOMM system kinase/cyclase fusion protein
MKFARMMFPGVDDVFQDRYKIQAEIGAGGFGTVYKAVQLATGQQVAIKVLRLQGARDQKTIERRILRLEREMRLCAQLHHPNIVGLIDFGRSDDGDVFSVFEFVPGKNLEELLAEEGAVDPNEARHLMLEVLDALSCAHAQGVIHRDLKPSNIMVIPTGARRNALVLDFGIGAVTDNVPGTEHSRLTATNEVLGTIAYASPEQLFSRPTSPASDLYSWGLVFLECLTGQPVVHGTSMMDALIKQVAANEVEMPAVLAAHPLGRLLRAVLAKKMEDRPASAREVMEWLESCTVTDLRKQDLAQPYGAPRPDESSSGPRSPFEVSKTQIVQYAPAPVEPAPPSIRIIGGEDALSGERRQVTAVCATLSVVPAADSPLDIEEADQLLYAGQETCARIAARFRGHPTGAMGNQTVFWFGFPSADEDDARRAARAALEMVADLERDAEAQKGAGKPHLEVRIGIHTGIVVSRAGGSPAMQRLVASFGVTSNVVSQLSSIAAPGEIVVSGSTHPLLRQHFSFAALGPRPLAARGVDAGATMETYRLEWPISGAHGLGEGRPDTPLIGREAELDLLLARWNEARRGKGQIVTITGEVGIGKSRLVRELSARIRNVPHRWLECRSAPENQNTPLRPIVEMLERTLDLADEETPQGKLAKLRSLLQSLDFTLDDNVPLFSTLLGIPLNGNGKNGQTKHELAPHVLKEQLLNALLAMFFELSEREAVILVAEDLHWTDATTLELYTKIVQEASSARILVLFSARPAFVPPWKTADVLQVHLGRLGRDQVKEMVSGLSGNIAPPSSGVIDQIVDRTDGVPLFIEELTRMMHEAGMLAQTRAGRASLRASAAEVPGTLRDLLTARLDRLGRAKGTAQIAAALGREFTFEVLSAVSPENPKLLQEDLDALVAADLVHRKRRVKGQSYAFKHALIRDTAYESMLKRARQKVHATIARVLTEQFADTQAARPDLLAHHHAEAGHERSAVQHILKAAEASLARSSHAEAIGHATQALAWLTAVDPSRERSMLELRIQSLLIAAHNALRGPGSPEVEAAIVRAQALVDELGDTPFAIPTLVRLALHYQMRARFAEAIAVCQQCISLAERVGDSGTVVAALTTLAQNYLYTGQHEASRSAALRALALFDPQEHASHVNAADLDFRATCYGTLAFVTWFLGHPDQALAQAQRGLALMEEADHANSIAFSLLYLASVHRYRRDPQRLGATCGRLHELSQKHGLHMGAFAGVFFGALTGDVDVPQQILGGLRAYGQVFSMPYWSSTIAETDAAAGRLDAAIARIDECIRDSESTGEVHYLPELLRLKATFLLRRDPASREDARELLQRAVALSREHKSRMCELRALTALGPLANGDAPQVSASLEGLLAEITEGAELPDLQEARSALASLRG